MMITTNNTPDLAVYDPSNRFVYTTVYVVISLFNFVMASGIIVAVINFKYREILIEDIEETSKCIPEYERDIMK